MFLHNSGDSELKRDHSRSAEEQIVTANPDLRTVCGISCHVVFFFYELPL